MAGAITWMSGVFANVRERSWGREPSFANARKRTRRRRFANAVCEHNRTHFLNQWCFIQHRRTRPPARNAFLALSNNNFAKYGIPNYFTVGST